MFYGVKRIGDGRSDVWCIPAFDNWIFDFDGHFHKTDDVNKAYQLVIRMHGYYPQYTYVV